MSLNTHVATSEKEIQDALSIRKAVFVEEQQISQELEFDGLDDECIHFVGYSNSDPISAGRLRILNDTGKVQRICVLKDFRGLDAGKQVMEKIHQTATDHNLSQLVLNAQETAIPFYEKLGYTISSDYFYEAGIRHAEMKFNLK